jgi:hypothetical protein
MANTINSVQQAKIGISDVLPQILHPESAEDLKADLKQAIQYLRYKPKGNEDNSLFTQFRNEIYDKINMKIIGLIEKYRVSTVESYSMIKETALGIIEAVDELPEQKKGSLWLAALRSNNIEEVWEAVIDRYDTLKMNYAHDNNKELFFQLFDSAVAEEVRKKKSTLNDIKKTRKAIRDTVGLYTEKLGISKIEIVFINRETHVEVFCKKIKNKISIETDEIPNLLDKIQKNIFLVFREV